MYFLLVISEELENFEIVDKLEVGVCALGRNGKISMTGPREGILVKMKHVDFLDSENEGHGNEDVVTQLPHDNVLHEASLAIHAKCEQVLK